MGTFYKEKLYRKAKFHHIFFEKSLEKSPKIGYTISWYKFEIIYGGI